MPEVPGRLSVSWGTVDRADNGTTTPIRKVGRFSREFLATLLAVVSTALGVVVALAWNEALGALFRHLFKTEGSRVIGLMIYAATITAVAVVVLVSLGNLAKRLDAEPMEFKYPVKKKDDEG